MEPVKIEELKDQTEQNISTAEESASEAPFRPKVDDYRKLGCGDLLEIVFCDC